MKRGRIWLALTSAFALCLALVACGGGGSAPAGENNAANFAGVWELSGMVEDGEEYDTETLDLMKSYGLNIYLVLDEDGTGELNMFGEGVDISWSAKSATEATINIASSDDDVELTGEVPMTLADGVLTLSQDEESISFTKTTQEAMDAFLAGAGTDDGGDSSAGGLGITDNSGNNTTTTSTDTGSWTGELTDTYADSTYGYSFMAPAGGEVQEQEDGRIRLSWHDEYDLWVNAYVVEDEADNGTLDEVAAYLEEEYEATIETTTDSTIIAHSTDGDGDTNYTYVVRSGSDDYFMDIYYHPADEGVMWEVAQAIMASFTV